MNKERKKWTKKNEQKLASKLSEPMSVNILVLFPLQYKIYNETNETMG